MKRVLSLLFAALLLGACSSKYNGELASPDAEKGGDSSFDIAFIVDATGSMSDEINFLKADLESIINTVGTRYSDAAIRTAALFYRDEGDQYLTRVNNFNSNISATVSFISQQTADGGDDYKVELLNELIIRLIDQYLQ